VSKLNLVPAEGALRFVTIDAMARDLGNVCPRTVKRMAKTDPDFPLLTMFGNRYYAAEHGWADYKQKLLERGMQARPLAEGMKRGGSPGRPRKTAGAA
jgi:hypothetical protein